MAKSKFSRHPSRIRVAGPLAARDNDPSENCSHRIRVRVSGSVYPPSKSRASHGRHPESKASFQVIEIQTLTISSSGRQSGLGRVYHPLSHPSKSSRHRFSHVYHPSAGPLFTHRSLDPFSGPTDRARRPLRSPEHGSSRKMDRKLNHYFAGRESEA